MGIYYDKILGSFVGAAAGDALGAITETYSMDKINEVYGGISESRRWTTMPRPMNAAR